MSGHVWVESSAGAGATFAFRSVMKKASSDVPKHYSSATLAGKKNLVVDENKTNITILESILKSAGIKVTLLLQGNKTIETLEQSAQQNKPFDTAILAHPLTTINGCNLAENIRRSNLRFANIPLLAYSSSSEKIAATCKAAGFNGFSAIPAPRYSTAIAYSLISAFVNTC